MFEIDNDVFQRIRDSENSRLPMYKPPEIHPVRYDGSILKDLAEDIKSTQDVTNEQLLLLIDENRKSAKISFRLAVASIIVSTATLIVTFVGVYFQLFK